MKIKKILNEEYRHLLREGDENLTVDEVDPNSASVNTIAKAIQGTVNKYSDETVSKAAADEAAQEVKQAATEINNSTLAYDPTALPAGVDEAEFVGCENKMTRILDKALASTRTQIRRGWTPATNVLVIGLPGSGKTSIVYDWADRQKPKIQIFYLNVKDPKLEAALFGMTARDMANVTSNEVTQLRSRFLDPLDRPNSVLFIDEYNRGKGSNRAALLDLINKHTISGVDLPEVRAARIKAGKKVDDGNRHFDNLLFTIAVMNPPADFDVDPTAQPLATAETSRFLHVLNDMDSDPETSWDFIEKYFTKQIKKLDENSPYFWEDGIEYVKKMSLLDYILHHNDFNFDTKAVDAVIAKSKGTIKQLNSRALTMGIFASPTAEDALDWVENTSDFLKPNVEALSRIIKEYIATNAEPTDEECKAEIASIRGDANLGTPNAINLDDGVEDDETLEDDGADELAQLRTNPDDVSRDLDQIGSAIDAWQD